jgi:hypothetical protein
MRGLAPKGQNKKMTIRIPPENILDKILKLFGKEREVIIPEEAGQVYRDIGPYVQIKGKRESFFKALFRKTGKQESEKEK